MLDLLSDDDIEEGATSWFAALIVILNLARRVRKLGQFLIGLCGVVLGVLAIWRVPALIGVLPDRSDVAELEGPLLVGALILAVSLIAGGIFVMATSERFRDDDEEQNLE